MPADRRDPLIERLSEWYASDPSSTIHAASGWLLRHWGYEAVTRQIDQTPLAYDPEREWFVVEVPLPNQAETASRSEEPLDRSCFLTFVVIPAGEYRTVSIGNLFESGVDVLLGPAGEASYVPTSRWYRVQVSRPFAVLDREITFGELQAFGVEGLRHQSWTDSVLDRAAVGPTWYEAVQFCRWLSALHGLTEEEQAYPAIESLRTAGATFDVEGNPIDWPVRLDRQGFRLPLFVEHFVAGSAGLVRDIDEVQLLPYYAGRTDVQVSQGYHLGPAPPRAARPNLYGLFDIYGNPREWCHDLMAGPPSETGEVTVDASHRRINVVRLGGSGWAHPNEPHNRRGFRIAMTLPVTEPESRSPNP